MVNADSPQQARFSLPIARYRFLFEVVDPFRLPDYAGSMLRGAFGRSLKEVLCQLPERPACAGCPLIRECAYPWFFEDLGEAYALDPRDHAPPRPFALEPQATQRYLVPGSSFTCDLVLFGWANELLPYVILAFKGVGEIGLGARRARLALVGVAQEDPNAPDRWYKVYDMETRAFTPLPPEHIAVPEVPDLVRLRLTTPLRLKRRKPIVTVVASHISSAPAAGLQPKRNKQLVTPEQFAFADLYSNLLRRAKDLQKIYAPEHAEEGADVGLPALNDDPIYDQKLRWYDPSRWSNRQDTSMKLGGLLGSLTLEGEALGPVWPLLWLGQWLHAGNDTSFGLGRYVLEPGGLSNDIAKGHPYCRGVSRKRCGTDC